MARGALPKNGAEAKADAEKAAALDPSLGLAHMALAWAESDERDFSAARRSYEDAYRASPKNTRILVEYARFLARFGEQARGERLAEQAVELAPNGYAEYILYGQVLALRGDLSGALAQFQRAAAIAPAFAGSFSQIAVTQLALGHKAAARENIERAQALWSAPPSWALASLAYVYGRLGEQAKAEKFAQALDAMAAAGEQRVELEHELETALGLGDRERVRRLLTEMVETCPDACNVEPGYLRRFKINWLNDPMLTEPEFAELRSRMPVH